MSELNIRERRAGDVTVLDLRGDLIIGAGGKTLESRIEDLVLEGKSKILLNLAQVAYVDSCGLGNLISASNLVRRERGQLKLLNLTRRVRDLMVITKLVTVFDVFDEEAAALTSYR